MVVPGREAVLLDLTARYAPVRNTTKRPTAASWKGNSGTPLLDELDVDD